MKIAICSQGETPQAAVDSRFGRCAYFAFTDENGVNWHASRNPNLEAAGGAGVQTAQFLCEQGVSVLLVDNLGPKAAQVLQASGIQVYSGIKGTVTQALQDYTQNQLQRLNQATVASHFGTGMGRQQRRGGGEEA